jgi:hypothetical protein
MFRKLEADDGDRGSNKAVHLNGARENGCARNTPCDVHGSRANVVIERTDANSAALDYFYEKLKDGVNV